MKNIFLAIMLVVFSASFAIATPAGPTVNDNTGTTGKTGTGSFGATVIMPLEIETLLEGGFVGEFVKSSQQYTGYDAIFESSSIIFKVTGEIGRSFYYTIKQNTLGVPTNVATIELTWIAGTNGLIPEGSASASDGSLSIIEGENPPILGVLGEDGFMIEANLVAVNAPINSDGGLVDFEQTVTVSYNF